VEVTFHGAAREVTGSCHIVRAAASTLLLDCGLFQGKRAEVQEKNFSVPVDPTRIDAVLLSHAHTDHAGRLPLLVRRGFRGPIFATDATRDLCAAMLADAAHIQQKDAEFLARRGRAHFAPLYDGGDVDRMLELMRGVRYGETVEVASGVRARFVDAGHILGSASVELETDESNGRVRLGFSGDIGRAGLALVRDPVPPADLDAVIMESTYGDRVHPDVGDAKARLAAVVRETAARGGRVLVPAFAVGRTQELVYDLHELVSAGAIPALPIIIDSPLATEATRVFRHHTDLFDEREPFVRRFRGRRAGLLEFPLVEHTASVDESKAIAGRRGPMVVIAASGMAESGRILHHLLNGASDPRNTVLIVSFQAEHTLGRRLVERRPVIRVFGEEVPLRATVEVIDGYSAHADRTELERWLAQVRARSPRLDRVFLVHGEPPAQQALAESLTRAGLRVDAPARDTRVTLPAA
jgi:metallo-beta-lactamase family protein